jgi:electron transfer flavoprotein beta subunit
MRGIMQARQKSLTVLPANESQVKSSISKFEKPAPKGEVKMVDANQIDQLIELLHNEAKVI